MSLADVMLLQAIFALAATVCEVPSGYVADRIGYRGSLLFAAWLWFAGWILYVLAGSFAGAVVAELALGTAIAFASGADSALLWVALERAGRPGEYTRWEGRLQAAAQTAESLSAVCGGYLYAVAPAPVALLAPAPVGVARARGRPPHTRGTADERWGTALAADISSGCSASRAWYSIDTRGCGRPLASASRSACRASCWCG